MYLTHLDITKIQKLSVCVCVVYIFTRINHVIISTAQRAAHLVTKHLENHYAGEIDWHSERVAKRARDPLVTL